MKKRYEKNKLIVIFCIMFFISIFLFCLFLFNKKVVVYKNISGVVFSDNVVTFLVDDDELKLFSSTDVVYFLGKKLKFKIKQIDKDVLEKNGISYNYLYLKIMIPDNYKVNDLFNVSVVEEYKKCIEIFKIVWEV